MEIRVHEVVPGQDTLVSVAVKYGVSVAALKRCNKVLRLCKDSHIPARCKQIIIPEPPKIAPEFESKEQEPSELFCAPPGVLPSTEDAPHAVKEVTGVNGYSLLKSDDVHTEGEEEEEFISRFPRKPSSSRTMWLEM
jgi:hypothetical protein